MKNLKIFFLSALVAMAGLFTACSNDSEWAPGDPAEGPQVYIPAEVATSYTLSTEDEAVMIPVVRVETVGSIEVPVMAVIAEEDVELFTVPASVVFADGVAESSLEIAFDRASMEDGMSYQVAITLDDPTMTTPYGNSSATFTFSIPEPYVLMGKALVWDGIVYPLYTGEVPVDPFEVEVYEHLNYPGYIFLKNLYTKMYPVEYFLDFGLTEEQIPNYVSYPEEDVYFVIDITNPNAVDVPVQKIGLNMGDGEMTVGMLSDAGGAAEADCFGTLKNGVISFPAKKMFIADNEGTYYANSAGGFKVALPGAVLTDFSVEAEAAGHVADQGGNASPVVNVTAGADVAGVAVGFVAGDVTADYASVVATVAAEKPNYTAVVEGACTVAGSEPMEAGQVTAVVVPFDANGVAQVEDAIAIAFYFAGCGAAELPECEIFAVVDVFSALFGPGYESQYPDSSTMGFGMFGTDIVSANIAFVTGLSLSQLDLENDIEGEEAQAVLDFIVSQIGDVMQALSDSHIAKINSENGLGLIFDELPAGMPHIGFVEATNSYGVTKLIATCGYTAAAEAATPAEKAMAGLKLMQFGGVKTIKHAPLR